MENKVLWSERERQLAKNGNELKVQGGTQRLELTVVKLKKSYKLVLMEVCRLKPVRPGFILDVLDKKFYNGGPHCISLHGSALHRIALHGAQ